MKWGTLTVIAILLLLVVVTHFFGKHLLSQVDLELVSSADSPNGLFSIKHYRSRSETGHAPYGDNLIIESSRSFPSGKTGETFFAGYCEEPLEFEWAGDERIIIKCKTSSDPIRTQAIVVHGIKVEVITE